MKISTNARELLRDASESVASELNELKPPGKTELYTTLTTGLLLAQLIVELQETRNELRLVSDAIHVGNAQG